MTPRYKYFLFACIFLGLPAGGLRSPEPWTFFAAALWLAALLAPAPSGAARLKAWLPWLAWAALSAAACDQPWKGLPELSRWTSLVAFSCLISSYWEEADFPRWMTIFCAVFAALGLGTLVLKGVGHPMTGMIPPYYNYTVFVEAAFAAAALALLLHPGGAKGKQRWVLFGLIAFALFLMLKARSRSGLVALAAAAALWMIRHGKIRLLLGAALALAAAAAFLPESAMSHLLKLDLSQWFTRPSIWKASLQVLGDHPFLGEGLGNFEQGFSRHNFPKFWATNYGFSSDHAHSEFLEIAVETGWIGLALFLAALFSGFKLKPRGESGPAREAGICAFSAMAVHCLFDNMLHIPALGMLFLSCLFWASSKPKLETIQPGYWRLFCWIGLFLCLSAWVPRWTVARYWDIYHNHYEPEKRAGAMKDALDIFPADYYLHETLARAYLEFNPPQSQRAWTELETACALNPTNALYPAMLAELSEKKGLPAQALTQLDRALALEPNFLGARTARARLWARSGNKKGARLELADVLKRRAWLKDQTLFSSYDRAVVFFDTTAFKAAEAAAR